MCGVESASQTDTIPPRSSTTSTSTNGSPSTTTIEDTRTSTDRTSDDESAGSHQLSPEAIIGLVIGLLGVPAALGTVWMCYRQEADRIIRRWRRGQNEVELDNVAGPDLKK